MVQQDGKFTTIPLAKPLQMVRPDLLCHLNVLSADASFEHLLPHLGQRDRDMIDELTGSRRHAFLAARDAIWASAPEGFLAQLEYQDRKPIPHRGNMSLSHSHDHAVAIYHPNLAVGVDIEGERPQLHRIAGKFLNEADREAVAKNANPNWALRVLWGAKESLFKAANIPGLIWADDMVIDAIASITGVGRTLAHVRGRTFDILYQTVGSDCLVVAAERPSSWHVVITGGESTGKSSLAAALHAKVSSHIVPEFAREYLSLHGPEYVGEDVEAMCQGQVRSRDQALQKGDQLVLSDTDVLNYCVWTAAKYQKVPESVSRAWDQSTAHLHLLCAPDIPWESDTLRENPDSREALHAQFEHGLRAKKMPFVLIEGQGESRVAAAEKAIDQLMGR